MVIVHDKLPSCMAIVETASITCSISSSVVQRLRENRIAERAISSETPMLRKIRDGSKAPELHAEPWLTARSSIDFRKVLKKSGWARIARSSVSTDDDH